MPGHTSGRHLQADRRLAAARLDPSDRRSAAGRRGPVHRGRHAAHADQRAAVLQARLALPPARGPRLRPRSGARVGRGHAGGAGRRGDRWRAAADRRPLGPRRGRPAVGPARVGAPGVPAPPGAVGAMARVAIVTGASSGIGEATARRLDADGWSLILVARREERLRALSESMRDASYVAVDLTADDAPARVRAALDERHGGEVHLLVNNAGASRRATFGDRENGGYANVKRIMALNFDAPLRLTEELLPLLRASAPSAIVNVASVAGRIANARGSAYSASKFALIGWSEALLHEEREHGVHVGMVLPGFISTEGFPQEDIKARTGMGWMVKTPDKVADAIVAAGPGGKAEVTVPKFPYRVFTSLRAVAPGLVLGVAEKVGRR